MTRPIVKKFRLENPQEECACGWCGWPIMYPDDSVYNLVDEFNEVQSWEGFCSKGCADDWMMNADYECAGEY